MNRLLKLALMGAGVGAGMGGDASVAQRLISLFGPALVAIWPMSELSGTVAKDVSGNFRNGTYTGVDLAVLSSRVPGAMCPYFDGVNDYVDVYSAGLASAFNGQEGTFGALIRGANDATVRDVFTFLADVSNFVKIEKTTSDNTLDFRIVAGGTNIAAGIVFAGFSAVDMLFVAITWSRSNNRMRPYINAIQQGVDVTGVGLWSGLPIATRCAIGSTQGNTPLLPWKGYISYPFLLNREVTAAEMAKANTILGG